MNNYTLTELQKICKEKKIKGCSKLKKADIIKKIKNY